MFSMKASVDAPSPGRISVNALSVRSTSERGGCSDGASADTDLGPPPGVLQCKRLCQHWFLDFCGRLVARLRVGYPRPWETIPIMMKAAHRTLLLVSLAACASVSAAFPGRTPQITSMPPEASQYRDLWQCADRD